MAISDGNTTEREQQERERHESVARAISKASEVLKEKMSLDADTADGDLKYSEWMAALATAGFAFTLGTFEKIHSYSWLCSHRTQLNAGLALTCGFFLCAIGCSAVVLSLPRSFKAGFKETTVFSTLSCMAYDMR